MDRRGRGTVAAFVEPPTTVVAFSFGVVEASSQSLEAIFPGVLPLPPRVGDTTNDDDDPTLPPTSTP